MVQIPPPLEALIATRRGVYIHDTVEFIFSPGSSLLLSWAPRSGMVYAVFGMTFSKAVNVATDQQIYTGLFGFWHTHSMIREHWDPALASLMDYEYPHYLEVLVDDPVEIRVINNSGLIIRWDATIHYVELREENLPFLRRLWLQWMGISEEEARKIVEEMYGR